MEGNAQDIVPREELNKAYATIATLTAMFAMSRKRCLRLLVREANKGVVIWLSKIVVCYYH
jgi:hypothetical protein